MFSCLGSQPARAGVLTRLIARALLMLMLAVGLARPVHASDAPQPLSLDLAASSLLAEGRERDGPSRPLVLQLGLSHPVPWRVFMLDQPARLVIDLDAPGLIQGPSDTVSGADLVPRLNWGPISDQRSRVVVQLHGPMAVTTATMTPTAGGLTRLAVRLIPVTQAEFRPSDSGAALPALWGLPEPADVAASGGRRDGPPRVALDPGHGGQDPGATADGMVEAQLMLKIAQETARALQARGIEVVLTREDDSFLPLERRMTAARAAGADVFVSLHADALPAGAAAGAAVFVWNSKADDRAARELAARHDRDDLLGGLDLTGADDQVAAVLMDIARTDTGPRSQNLAQFLVSEFALGGIAFRKRPVKGAAFSVLKAPDFPSVLIETGFLSDPADRANLGNAEWRRGLAEAIARAIAAWAEDDAARDPLLRH